LAFSISAASSPFVVTALTAAIMVWSLGPSLAQLALWGAITVLFSAVIPFIIVFGLWRTGKVTDIHVAVREQRTVPFVAALVSAALGVVLLQIVGAPPQLVAIGAAFLVNGAALAGITSRWKISMHSAVLSGCIIALGLVVTPRLLILLAALPVVLWARHYRQRHTLAQGIVPILLVSALTPAVYLGAMKVLGGR
jgi:hypothetical protein